MLLCTFAHEETGLPRVNTGLDWISALRAILAIQRFLKITINTFLKNAPLEKVLLVLISKTLGLFLECKKQNRSCVPSLEFVTQLLVNGTEFRGL